MTEVLVRHLRPQTPDVVAAAKARQDAGEKVDVDELVAQLRSGMLGHEFEAYSDADVYDGKPDGAVKQVTDPDGTLRFRHRLDDLAEIDPSTYEVIDPVAHAKQNRLARIEADIAALQAERNGLL